MLQISVRTWVALLSIFAFVFPWAKGHDRPVRMKVLFVATSTSIRSSGGGGNQDVYLVELQPPRHPGHMVLARLVDNYADYASPIPRQILTSARPDILPLRRERKCDLPFEDIPLRTAPGDPRAILPMPLGFHSSLPVQPSPLQTVLCYRLARNKYSQLRIDLEGKRMTLR